MTRSALVVALAAAALLQALPAVLQSSRPAAAQSALAGPAIPESAEAARRALLRVLEEARAGEVRLERFTPDLADAVRAQAPGVVALLHRLGPIRSVTHLGEVPGVGIHQFAVEHENGGMNWAVGLSPEGRIADLVMERA